MAATYVFQIMVSKLVPTRGATLLTVTSQDWQMLSRKADQLTLDSRDTMSV